MKFKRNLLILSAILIAVLILVIGCQPVTPPIEGDVPSNGSISIAYGAAATNDATPPLTISATGADHMAFSGNGTTWSSWVVYATSHSTFNITTGAGCTSGDGTKIVYVKFKNDVGESTKVYDSIVLDTVAPTLSTAVYSDANSSSTVNIGDTITFTFDDEMLTSTVTSTNVATSLLLSAGNYGTSPTVSWDSTLKICTVTLGTSPTIVSGTTVNPASSVTDTAGNADASSAVTISGLLNVLAFASIAPSTAATTTSGAAVILTATALNTAWGNITSLCTFFWTITGVGTISPTTGSTIVYIPPSSGTGIAVIIVTAVYAGVTKPGTATITVSASAAAPTAALGGTVITGAPNTEANIVDGGKIITITLTNETWNAGTGTFGASYTDAEALVIITGLVAGDQGAQWDKVKNALIAASDGVINTAVVRTSATVLTINLPATATYDIATNQAVTMIVPAASVAGVSAILAAPVFVITAD